MILVVTGTHEQPFERLVRAADAYSVGHPDEKVFVQYGVAGPPRHATGRPFLERRELDELVRAADVIVTHGGPGAVLEAMAAGKVPVVCPRAKAYGEHVDDHQRRFTEHLVRHGRVVHLYEPAAFAEAVATAITAKGTEATRADRAASNRERLADALDKWLLG